MTSSTPPGLRSARPKSSARHRAGPARAAAVRAAAPSCSAVRSLWPTQRVPRSTLRAEQRPVDAVEQPRQAVAAARGHARSTGASSATRCSAASRVSSSPAKRWMPRQRVVVDLHVEAQRRAGASRPAAAARPAASTPAGVNSVSAGHRRRLGSPRARVRSPRRSGMASARVGACRRSRVRARCCARRSAKKSRSSWPQAVGQHAAVRPRCGGSAARCANRSTHRAGGAGLRVGGAEHHALEARVHQRHRAHRAGLERDVQLALGQPVVLEQLRGMAQRDDLGMRGRVVGR